MSVGRRILQVLIGLLMILLAVVMLVEPETGFILLATILSLSLTVYGVQYLIYYFTMARHMVGGKLLLFVSIIALDLGVFTGSILSTPQVYIILYLIGIHAFSGAISIMRSLEARTNGGSWRLTMVTGVGNVLMAAACVVFLRNNDVLLYIYAAGLVYAAAMRIVSAFRKTAIVYIQ